MALSQDQLLAILDRHVLLAERKVKRGLASLESAETQRRWRHKRRSSTGWRALSFENHEGTEKKANVLEKKVRAAKEIWSATTNLATAAEADLFEAKMEMKEAQMKVMMQEMEMGLAREEALLGQIDALVQKNEDLISSFSRLHRNVSERSWAF